MDSNEKTRDKRGFLLNGLHCLQALQVPLGQLRRGGTRILGNHLLQNAFDLVGMTQAAFYVSEFVQRIRHLGVLGVQLADLGKSLARALQITLCQVDLTQPVLGIARVLAVGVLAQESGEGLTGLIEILGLDQVEGCIVIQFFLRRITRFTAGGRGSRGGPCCCATGSGAWRATGSRIIRSSGRCNTGSNTTVKILVTLQAFLLQLVHLVLQNFNGALLLGQLILHALQLVEQFALCRGSGRSRSPRIGAVRAITRWRITAPAIVIA